MKPPKHPSTPASMATATLALATSLLAPSDSLAQSASADQIQADFTRSAAPTGWIPINGACITAGTGTDTYASKSPRSTIPSCQRIDYLGNPQVGGDSNQLNKAPDADGKGALRLTNGGMFGTSQAGAIISSRELPGNQGLNVTFSSVTYNGNSYQDAVNGKITGADGIGFFMVDAGPDGTRNDPTSTDPAKAFILGATGGALGISCSNGNVISDGLSEGFLGLGIDEFGNFMNRGDNTNTGTLNTTRSDTNFQGNRIGLRGRGNTNFRYLQSRWPAYYPESVINTLNRRQIVVRRACARGAVSDWSKVTNWNNSIDVPFKAPPPGSKLVDDNTAEAKLQNYAAIPLPDPAKAVLPWSQPIAATTTLARKDAKPIAYALRLTSAGLLDFSYSYNGGAYQKILSEYDITNGGANPLPSMLRFGFSSSTGGGTNVHELMCFKAATDFASSSTASVSTQESGQLMTGTQVFSSAYNADNWWGRVTARDLLYNNTSQTASLGPVTWDASCVLTGGTCGSTGVTGMEAQSPAARNILTWNGTSGAAFQWAALTTEMQTALSAGDTDPATTGPQRVAYLRGDRSNEYSPITGKGIFRPRTGILGDIQGSSPVLASDPISNRYPVRFVDGLYPDATAPETSYAAYAKARAGRQNVVLIGANDGMLHALRAGTWNGAAFDRSTNDGREVFAYVPGLVAGTIHSTKTSLDFSDRLYSHNFYVDAQPAIGDLFYAGQWHSWAVGGLGEGGAAIYALDVTNPSSVTESTASASVIGEWTNATITCANSANCGRSMGNTYGTPLIRRLHNGQWAVIFGNGVGSSTGTAGVFLMLVDPATGTRTFRFLDTGKGPTTTPFTNGNGIMSVTSADLDGDSVTDYLYAGDLWGNVWRFDITSDDVTRWGVSGYGSSNGPLFAGSPSQPITSAVTLTVVTSTTNDPNRLIVSFGTGRKHPQTLATPATYATERQALYGIWDANFERWNAVAKKSATVASLATIAPVTPTSRLRQQTMTKTTVNGIAARTISSNAICWKGSTSCTGTNEDVGWTIPLDIDPTTKTAEQVISGFTFYKGVIVLNTLIPNSMTGTICIPQKDTGYTMAISPSTGGQLTGPFFPGFTTSSGGPISGLQLGFTGSVSIVSTTSTRGVLIGQKGNGDPEARDVSPPAGIGDRITWIEYR